MDRPPRQPPVFTRGVPLVSALLYGGMMAWPVPWQAVLGAAVLGLVLPLRFGAGANTGSSWRCCRDCRRPRRAGTARQHRACSSSGSRVGRRHRRAGLSAGSRWPRRALLTQPSCSGTGVRRRRRLGNAAAALPLLQQVRSRWTIVHTDEAFAPPGHHFVAAGHGDFPWCSVIIHCPRRRYFTAAGRGRPGDGAGRQLRGRAVCRRRLGRVTVRRSALCRGLRAAGCR